MGLKAFKNIKLILAAVLMSGCQAVLPVAGPHIDQLGEAEGDKSGARAYHYFLAAQYKLKQGDVTEAIWLLDQAIKNDSISINLKLEMANLLLIKKETDKALEQINQALTLEPNNIEALTLLGGIHQQRKEMDEAKATFERVFAGNPSEQNIYLLLGRIYWNESDFNNAERVFCKMAHNIPDSYAAHFFYGKALAAQGKADQAEASLLKSLELEPSLEETRLELLNIYKLQNKPDKITQVYKAILQYTPDNHNATLGLAEHYRQIHQKELSRQLLTELGQHTFSDASIITAVYDAFLENKRYDEALWALEGMLAAAQENSDLHYMAGIASDGLDRKEAALAHMIRVAPKSRFYVNAVVHSALLYHDMGKIHQSIEVIRNALVHTPGHAEYYLYLGSFYEEVERYAEALDVLQKGLTLDDQNARLYFRLGVIYDKMGRKQDSISSMKQVVRLTPNDAEALNYLGYTYADMGINLDEAEILIQSALKIKPDDGYIKDSLGWVYYKKGRYSEALKWLTKAIQLVPDDPAILEHLGDVYLKLERKQKALNYYRRSLQKKDKDTGPLEDKIRSLKGSRKN